MYSSGQIGEVLLHIPVEGLAAWDVPADLQQKKQCPIKVLEKWSRDTQGRIAPVEITGMPGMESRQPSSPRHQERYRPLISSRRCARR